MQSLRPLKRLFQRPGKSRIGGASIHRRFATLISAFTFSLALRASAVDCVVVSETGADQFLERERHGEPQIQFDRSGRIAALPVDREALNARRALRRGQLRGAVPVYRMLVEKELARGHPLEALGFYQALLRALIELLGMRYRPERFDYGWRYVENRTAGTGTALDRTLCLRRRRRWAAANQRRVGRGTDAPTRNRRNMK